MNAPTDLPWLVLLGFERRPGIGSLEVVWYHKDHLTIGCFPHSKVARYHVWELDDEKRTWFVDNEDELRQRIADLLSQS